MAPLLRACCTRFGVKTRRRRSRGLQYTYYVLFSPRETRARFVVKTKKIHPENVHVYLGTALRFTRSTRAVFDGQQ